MRSSRAAAVRTDYTYLGECIGFCIFQEHQCAENILRDGLGIFYASYEENRDDRLWILSHFWIADEKEVYDGEANEVGEMMACSSFRIQFCPFCGLALRLNEQEASTF
jgi:hypothetical protein